MMNYEIFKEVVKEKFMDYMPEKFKGMELVAEPAERAYEQAPVVDVDSIMRDANEKIVFQLINTEQNKTFLEQVPHREFQDLSIVCSQGKHAGGVFGRETFQSGISL